MDCFPYDYGTVAVLILRCRLEFHKEYRSMTTNQKYQRMEEDSKRILPDEITAQLRTCREALTECFGGYEEDDQYFTVKCCGPIRYGSGIFGTDIVKCEGCGKKILMILSPHVSPLLISGSTTAIPTQELFDEVGDKCWMVFPAPYRCEKIP